MKYHSTDGQVETFETAHTSSSQDRQSEIILPGVAEVSATSMYTKGTGMVISIISPFHHQLHWIDSGGSL